MQAHTTPGRHREECGEVGGDLERVKQLLREGIDVNTKDHSLFFTLFP
jgi:hypothetical protein